MKKKILAIICIFLFSLILRLATLNEMGRTWDEQGYIETGYTFVQLFQKGDLNNKYWYEFPDHPPLSKYIYGVGAQFDYRGQEDGKLLFTYDFTFARLFSVLFSALTAVIILLIGWRFISPFVGVSSAVIFSLLPISLGYAQLASIESIRLFFFAATLYFFMSFLEKPKSWLLAVLAGISLGCALETKQTAIIIYPLLAIIFFLKGKQKQKKKKTSTVPIKKLLFIYLVSLITFFILWPMPWFHLDYVYNFSRELWFSKLGMTSVPEVFMGRLMLVPKIYYFVYFFITTPVLILACFFLGTKYLLKERSWIAFALILAFCFPFVLTFYSLQQHGVRYILEIYVPLSIISAIGLQQFSQRFKNKKAQYIALIFVTGYLALTLFRLTPYYLEYFNELVGGTNTVHKYRLFQQGWWGQGEREAGLYINEHAPAKAKIGLAISPDHTYPKSDKLIYEPWSPKEKYDYVVVNHYHIIRDNFDDSLIRKNYNLVYEVKADGAVLAYIYKKK